MILFARSASAKPRVKVIAHFDPQAAWVEDVIAARPVGSDPKRYLERQVSEALNVTFPVFTFLPDSEVDTDKNIHVVLRPSNPTSKSALSDRQVQMKLCFSQPIISKSHADCSFVNEWAPGGVTASESEEILGDNVFREKLKHAAQRDQQLFLLKLNLPIVFAPEAPIGREGRVRTSITYEESGAAYATGVFFRIMTQGVAYRFQACFPIFIGGIATIQVVRMECGSAMPRGANIAPQGAMISEIFYDGTYELGDSVK